MKWTKTYWDIVHPSHQPLNSEEQKIAPHSWSARLLFHRPIFLHTNALLWDRNKENWMKTYWHMAYPQAYHPFTLSRHAKKQLQPSPHPSPSTALENHWESMIPEPIIDMLRIDEAMTRRCWTRERGWVSKKNLAHALCSTNGCLNKSYDHIYSICLVFRRPLSLPECHSLLGLSTECPRRMA